MTPRQLAKAGTEHAHQVVLFAWAAVAAWNGFVIANLWAESETLPKDAAANRYPIPCLKWLHAIHNQGHGDAIRGGRAKAEGVRAGIPDIFLPFPYHSFNGLYIEMKKPSSKPIREGSKGGLSDEQIEFSKFAIANGYCWSVAYGWEEASKIIQAYLS